MLSQMNAIPRFGGAYVTRTDNPDRGRVDYKVEYASQPQDELDLNEVVVLKRGSDDELARIYDPRVQEICEEIDRGEQMSPATQKKFLETLRAVFKEPAEIEGDNPFSDEFISATADQREPASQRPTLVADTHWFTQTLFLEKKQK